MQAIRKYFGLLLCEAIFMHQPSIAHERPSPENLYSAREVAPPAVDKRSIALSSGTGSPGHESWLDIESPADHAGFAGPSILRNVSAASLTPFLPNEKTATGAAVIIAPGGGGVELSMETQGYQVARWLNERGIAAFVLKYRLVPTPKETAKFLELITKESGTALEGVVSAKDAAAAAAAATQDGLAAVAYVRRHRAQWRLRRDRIGLLGFSSGAFTTLNVVLAGGQHDRPDLVALAYGALADWDERIPASAPPAFIVAATDDLQVPAVQGVMVYKAWVQAKVPAELHVFETGGHGFGMNKKGTSSDQWLGLFESWLRAHDFESKGDRVDSDSRQPERQNGGDR